MGARKPHGGVPGLFPERVRSSADPAHPMFVVPQIEPVLSEPAARAASGRCVATAMTAPWTGAPVRQGRLAQS